MPDEFYYLNYEYKLYALGRIIIRLYNLKPIKRILRLSVLTNQINLNRWRLSSQQITVSCYELSGQLGIACPVH
jgi:predicted enzyme involved in methoxymalonyl-ACP biosynthesis